MKEFLIIFLITICFFLVRFFLWQEEASDQTSDDSKNEKVEGEGSSFLSYDEEVIYPIEDMDDKFFPDRSIEEVRNMDLSADAVWWVNSGGQFVIENGIAHTIIGELLQGDFWQIVYKKNNPRDTDAGHHPQNIFRLVTQDKWKNFQQEAYFRIVKDNLSESEYRSESNGLLLFNRYQDGDNLYYTGVRVDGFAVIKKKTKGKYYTMAYNRIFSGEYDRKKSPNLLPHGEWVGIRSEVKTEDDGTVSIKVFMDQNRTGDWQLIAEAVDDGKSYGGTAITQEGYAGIRTDFMDVEFDDYKIEEM